MLEYRTLTLAIAAGLSTGVAMAGAQQKELTKKCQQGDTAACQELAKLVSGKAQQKLGRMQDKRLEKALNDIRHRKADRRVEAAETLGDFKDPVAVEALTGALADEEASVREEAASSLWTLNDIAASAEPALRVALGDEAPGVQMRVAGALAAMGVDREELLDTYRQVLPRGDMHDRFLAARGLIGHDDGASLLPHLLEFARAQAEPADKRFGTPSFTRAQETNQELTEKAFGKLAKTQQREVIPPLAAELNSPPWMRSMILTTLNVFEPKPEGWVDLLIRTLADDELRDSAINFLGQRASDPAEVGRWAPEVAKYVPTSPHPALRALGQGGGFAHEGLPAVLTAVEQGDDSIRSSAAATVGAICDRSQPIAMELKRSMAASAQPVLVAAAQKETDISTQRTLLRSFMKLELEPTEQLPVLMRFLESDQPNVIWVALQSIRDIAPHASSAASSIEPLTQHADQAVRKRAEDALKAIAEGGPSSGSTAPAPAGAADPAREQQGLAVLRERGVKFDERSFSRAITTVEPELDTAFLDAGMSADHHFSRLGFNTLHTLLESQTACNPAVRPTPDATKQLVQLFLERGADVNARHEGGGNTPLMFGLFVGSSGWNRLRERALSLSG